MFSEYVRQSILIFLGCQSRCCRYPVTREPICYTRLYFPQLLNKRGPQCTAVYSWKKIYHFFVAKISSCQPVISWSISLLTLQSEKICVGILHYRPIRYHLRMEIVKEDLIPCSGDLSMVAEICFIVKPIPLNPIFLYLFYLFFKPIPLNPIGNVAQSKANMKNF